MKIKLLFTYLFLVSYISLTAQSFSLTYEGQEIANGGTLELNVELDEADFGIDVMLENISGTAKTVKLQRELVDVVDGHLFYFCVAGKCYLPTSNVSDDFVVDSGAESDLQLHMLPGGKAGNSILKYSIVSAGETYVFNIKYKAGNEGVNDFFATSSFSDVYPNPATNQINFNYDFSSEVKEAKVIIFNLLGSQVAELPINNSVGKLTYNCSDLNSGIYFYSLRVDNKDISTKKLVIRK